MANDIDANDEPLTHRDGSRDNRYSVCVEFTGNLDSVRGLKSGQSYVARFCGEWIAARNTLGGAWAAAYDWRRATFPLSTREITNDQEAN